MTGCPIRTSQDQSLFDGSPGLIAAYHVLHRLVTPRHSPCTLTSLAAFVVDPQTFTVGRQTKPSRFGTSRFHFAFTEKITSATPYPVVKEPWRPADPIGLLACFIFPRWSRSGVRPVLSHLGQALYRFSFKPSTEIFVLSGKIPNCLVETRRELLVFQLFRYRSFFSPLRSTGDERDRTADLLVANQTLSQLSYVPGVFLCQRQGEPQRAQRTRGAQGWKRDKETPFLALLCDLRGLRGVCGSPCRLSLHDSWAW
jgi:hypothetical protein